MTMLEAVTNLIVDEFGVDRGLVKPESQLVDDLGLDSLDAVELVMAVEEQFGIEVPDEDAEKITTVDGIVKYLEGRNVVPV